MPNKAVPWVGIKNGKRTLVICKDTPTFSTYGHLYNAMIGPFRTVRAADYMIKHGINNPHLLTVNDAERLAKG